MFDVLKNLGKLVGVAVQGLTLKTFTDLKEATKPPIVEFDSELMKETMRSAIKNFNKDKSKEEKLSTRHLNISGPTKTVYVSETISQKNKISFI